MEVQKNASGKNYTYSLVQRVLASHNICTVGELLYNSSIWTLLRVKIRGVATLINRAL